MYMKYENLCIYTYRQSICKCLYNVYIGLYRHHTLTCGCGFRCGGAVPRGAVLGAGAGVVQKYFWGADAGAGAVG